MTDEIVIIKITKLKRPFVWQSVNKIQATLHIMGQAVTKKWLKFRSTKKQKNLNVGTLFEKSLEEIYGQTLQIWGFLNTGNIQFF